MLLLHGVILPQKDLSFALVEFLEVYACRPLTHLALASIISTIPPNTLPSTSLIEVSY